MSGEGKRTARPGAQRVKNDGLILGGEPRVQLLPPEVGLRAKARNVRRIAVLFMVLALVVVGAGYAFSVLRGIAAQGDLATAQQRTQELLAEQLQYSEASRVSSLLDGVEQARTIGASTEILWANLIAEVRATLPAGVTLESASLTGRAPWEPELTPTGPLRSTRVANVMLVVTSPTIFDASAIVRALAGVTGFADATPDTITGTPGAYSTTITLNVDELALSNRFAAGVADVALSPAPSPSSTPAPVPSATPTPDSED